MRELDHAFEVLAVSRAYDAEPVGAPGTPNFLNAAVSIVFEGTPAELKYGYLRPIEARLGRRRSSDPNAPRTIDIDIAIYGPDEIVDADTAIRIPDPDIPRMPHLAFPLRDVAPEFRHPAFGETLARLAQALGDQPGVKPRPDIDLAAELTANRESRW